LEFATRGISKAAEKNLVMKKFRYRGKTQDGKPIHGWVEAVNAKTAAVILRSRNLIVFDLNEEGKSFLDSSFTFLQRISSNDIVSFTRQLATMINAGLPLTNALESLQDQAKPALAKVLAEILNDVRGGTSLYQALAKHPRYFSPIYLALVQSGEAAGLLDKVLSKLADNLEKQRSFASRVKSAMIYPVIVIIAMIVVAFLMMIFVIPKLLGMYKEMGAQLPLPTQILISLADFMAQFWWLIILTVVGSTYGFLTWRSTAIGRRTIDAAWFKIPLVGSLKEKVILASLTRTLAMLIGTGVSIIEALNIVAGAAGNVVFEEAIKKSAKEVEKGLPLANSFAQYEFIPPLVSQMIAVGEETGKLDEVLLRVADHFEEESDLAIKGLTAAIEPIMIILLGIGVGFLVISIILPIYNLTSQF
jgi:type IV pilus assembly protein PilC